MCSLCEAASERLDAARNLLCSIRETYGYRPALHQAFPPADGGAPDIDALVEEIRKRGTQ